MPGQPYKLEVKATMCSQVAMLDAVDPADMNGCCRQDLKAVRTLARPAAEADSVAGFAALWHAAG